MTLRNTFAFIGRLLIAGYFVNSVVVHVQRPETMAPLVKQIVSTFAVPAAYKFVPPTRRRTSEFTVLG